jgi:hypothetical protein
MPKPVPGLTRTGSDEDASPTLLPTADTDTLPRRKQAYCVWRCHAAGHNQVAGGLLFSYCLSAHHFYYTVRLKKLRSTCSRKSLVARQQRPGGSHFHPSSACNWYPMFYTNHGPFVYQDKEACSVNRLRSGSHLYHGHEHTSRLCARFVHHLFTCPDVPSPWRRYRPPQPQGWTTLSHTRFTACVSTLPSPLPPSTFCNG